MKDFKPYILSAIIAVFAGIFIAGCIDAPDKPSNDITGTIYDSRGLPASNFKVSTGDYPITNSDHFGNFHLPGTTIPFDIVITGNRFSLKYTGIHIENPKVNFLQEHYGGIGFSINISVPRFNENQAVILKFITDETAYSDNYINPWNGDTLIGMGVYFDPGYKSSAGKLVYLLVTLDSHTGEILTYDAYGAKDVNLVYNIYNNFSFTPSEVTYNPLEIFSNINIEPPDSRSHYCSFYIHFTGMTKSNDIYLESFEDPASYIAFPVLPGIDYSIKTYSTYNFRYIESINGSKWIYTQPGENISITHRDALKLINPVNEQQNVNDTTKFIIEDDGIKGIYIFNLSYTSLVTDKNTVTLADFKSRGFTVYPESDYIWWAAKIPGYNSIDEFTSVNYIFDDRYNYIQISDYGIFTTGNSIK